MKTTNYKSRDMGRTVAVRRWTPTAIDCFERGCICQGCFYSTFFSKQEYATQSETNKKCQMKAAVLELVRVIGIPEGVKSKGVLNE